MSLIDAAILNLSPDIPADFVISPKASVVQFRQPLSDEDYGRMRRHFQAGRKSNLELMVRTPSQTRTSWRFPHMRRLCIELWSLSNLDGLKSIEALHCARRERFAHSKAPVMRRWIAVLPAFGFLFGAPAPCTPPPSPPYSRDGVALGSKLNEVISHDRRARRGGDRAL